MLYLKTFTELPILKPAQYLLMISQYSHLGLFVGLFWLLFFYINTGFAFSGNSRTNIIGIAQPATAQFYV